MNTPSPSTLIDSTRPTSGVARTTVRLQSESWEYKVAITLDSAAPTAPQAQEERLQQLRKNGWVFVGGDGGIFYLKRPKR